MMFKPYKSIYLSVFFLMIMLMSCGSKEKKPLEKEVKTIARKGFIKTSDSLNIFYKIEGNGKDTLVVIHGGPGMDSEYMVADFKPLAKKYTLLYYDQRGGGQSSLPENTDQLHINNHISDLETLRQFFELDKLNLIAHSFGPMVAAQYAIKYPNRVSKMVFLGPVPPMEGDFSARYSANLANRLSVEEQQQMGGFFQELIQGEDITKACKEYWSIALKPRLAEGLPVSIVKGDCCAAPPKAIRFGMQVTNGATFGSLGNWDLRPVLKNLNIATLILHGQQEAIPMDMVEEWELTMPNAKLIKVPEAGHFAYAEQPDIVWPAIEAFLETN